jgi:DNA-binding Lrp family transcriptional regulator
MMAKVKAYVLIVTDPAKTKDVYTRLQEIREIVEVHEVMGPYDIVCEIQVEDLTQIPRSLAGRCAGSPVSRAPPRSSRSRRRSAR